MKCDKCESDNTQRLQVVFEHGTHNVQTTSHTAGVGLARGGLGVGGARTTTSGVSSSLLAERAAPPRKKQYRYLIFFAFLALLVIEAASGMFFAFGLGVLALCAYLVYTTYRYNASEWPLLVRRWQAMWLCLKCGHIYHHD